MTYYILLSILALQRIHELMISSTNLERIRDRVIAWPPHSERLWMISIHATWFISTAAEYAWRGRMPSVALFLPGMALLAVCQYVRYKTISELGESWLAMPVVYRGQRVVEDGIYRWIRHPNYLVVTVEIALVPLLGHCFGTALIFSLLNTLFILNRIRIEDTALIHLVSPSGVHMSKKRLIPFLFFMLISIGSASEIAVQSPDFAKAASTPSFFKFEGRSTKLGIIGTSFEGYARKFTLSFDRKKDRIENIKLQIDAASLDTDNDARNEKLREKCLSVRDYPLIVVQIDQPLLLSDKGQEIVGTLLIRGKSVPVRVNVDVVQSNRVRGTSSFKLSDAGIPDPSILVASVRDEFKIEFQVEITEE